MLASDAVRIEPKPFLRFVAGLLNRCPRWVASPTPEGYLLAWSPIGVRYVFQVLSHPRALGSALQDVLDARQVHHAERAVLMTSLRAHRLASWPRPTGFSFGPWPTWSWPQISSPTTP